MQGVACSERVAFLRPAFEVFLNNLERFGEATNWGDLAHFYNERATVSLFAAACWQSGLIALEEFVSPKHGPNGSYSGRADFWAYCPIVRKGIAIEAKQMWPTITTKPPAVRDWLKEADAAAALNDHTDLFAGLTFFIPSLDPSESREDVVALFRRLHDEALGCEVDALAWWLPEKAMKHSSECRHTGKMRMWPGVLAALRVVRIRRRSAPILPKERLRETAWSRVPVLA